MFSFQCDCTGSVLLFRPCSAEGHQSLLWFSGTSRRSLDHGSYRFHPVVLHRASGALGRPVLAILLPSLTSAYLQTSGFIILSTNQRLVICKLKSILDILDNILNILYSWLMMSWILL